MRQFSNPFKLLVVGVTILSFATTSNASWWNPLNWMERNRAKRVETLLVTSNYVKSRILAELVQFEIKQPILLLPTANEPETIYFLSPTKETLEISKDDYLKFIDFLQPNKVLFLGNDSYVSDEYIALTRDRVATWSIANDDWETIAFSVGEMLRLKHLGFDYLVLLNQLDENGRLKPAASTDFFGGYITNEKWTPNKSSEPSN